MAKRKGFLAGLIEALVAPPKDTSTSRDRQPALTRLVDVVAIPPPPGWPLPPEREMPPTVDNEEYATTACPTCGVGLSPLPKAKKRCPSCGSDIHVAKDLDGTRHLLVADDVEGFKLRREDERTMRWVDRLQAAGAQVGQGELAVVGESNYHAALAGIRAGLVAEADDRRAYAIAALVCEPSNRYDRNAVQVVIHDRLVGYLSREDAEDYQDVLRSGPSPFFVQAVLVGGQPEGRSVGPTGVFLEEVPEP